MKTIILAGGKGTRLMPLTENKPKPMVEVLGKPILEHILESLIPFTQDVTIITKYKEEIIKDYFKDNFKGIRLSYHTQVDEKGTGAALIGVQTDNDFIVLNGDTIYDKKDLEKIYKLDGYGCLVKKVKEPSKYGIFKKDEDDNAIEIIEKPKKYVGNLANIGVYKFPKNIIDIVGNIKPSKRGEYEITDAINSIVKNKNIKLIEKEGEFIDIGYPQDIEKAENILKNYLKSDKETT